MKTTKAKKEIKEKKESTPFDVLRIHEFDKNWLVKRWTQYKYSCEQYNAERAKESLNIAKLNFHAYNMKLHKEKIVEFLLGMGYNALHVSVLNEAFDNDWQGQ